MRLSPRCGTSTIELLAALVLWGIVSTAVVAALLTTGRAARQTTIRAERREMLRAGIALVAFELRGSAGPPSTLRVTDHAIEYRGRRWTAVTCRWPESDATGLRLFLRDPILGERPPLPGRDSALVWIEGYPSDPDDGRWSAARVTDAAAATCPDGRSAIAIEVESDLPTGSAPVVQPGAAVVGYERGALRVYRGGDGEYWLGLATASSSGWNAVQPVTGPLTSSSGFALRSDARSVVIGLRAAGTGDSATAVVAIRAAEEVP